MAGRNGLPIPSIDALQILHSAASSAVYVTAEETGLKATLFGGTTNLSNGFAVNMGAPGDIEIVVANHGVPENKAITVEDVNQRKFRAEVESRDVQNDLAFLRINDPAADIKTLELDPAEPAPNQQVAAIPIQEAGAFPNVVQGEFLHTEPRYRETNWPYLPGENPSRQLDLLHMPGDVHSGGAILGANGKVTGLVDAGGGPKQDIVAVPASIIISDLEQLKEKRKSTQ